jgi:hypothetical protein
MFVLTEKIAPPSHQQIFNDYDRQDAAIAKRAEDERWLKQLVVSLAGKLRRIWK